jgi:hypothetical protein
MIIFEPLPLLFDTGIVLLLNLSGLAQMFLCHCDPTTGIANIAQFCQFRFADMPWVGYCSATVFASIGSLDLLGITEMAFFCSNHPTGLTLVNS